MDQKFMVEKSGVEKFMVEKSGFERSSVEAWGSKVRGWDVLQQLHRKKELTTEVVEGISAQNPINYVLN